MSPTDSCSFHHRVLYLICAAFNILLGGFCSPEDSINETDSSPDPIKRIFLYTISQIRYRLRYRSKLRRRTKLQTVSELRTLPSNHKNEETIVHTFKSMPESRDERCSIFLGLRLVDAHRARTPLCRCHQLESSFKGPARCTSSKDGYCCSDTSAEELHMWRLQV